MGDNDALENSSKGGDIYDAIMQCIDMSIRELSTVPLQHAENLIEKVENVLEKDNLIKILSYAYADIDEIEAALKLTAKISTVEIAADSYISLAYKVSGDEDELDSDQSDIQITLSMALNLALQIESIETRDKILLKLANTSMLFQEDSNMFSVAVAYIQLPEYKCKAYISYATNMLTIEMGVIIYEMSTLEKLSLENAYQITNEYTKANVLIKIAQTFNNLQVVRQGIDLLYSRVEPEFIDDILKYKIIDLLKSGSVELALYPFEQNYIHNYEDKDLTSIAYRALNSQTRNLDVAKRVLILIDDVSEKRNITIEINKFIRYGPTK